MDEVVWLSLILGLLGLGLIVVWNIEEFLAYKRLKRKYNVSKFPVTSKMGNQYFAEVIVKEDRYSRRILCNFYERKFKRNGKHKDKLIESNRIDFESFDYDYIKVVSQCIEDYEKQHRTELMKKKHEEELVEKNKQLFEQWDGVIKSEE